MPSSFGTAANIADVARVARVSAMTVSRVINNKAPVSAATRERVLRAMEELHYRPNSAAQALSSGRSRTIGVVTMPARVEAHTSILAGIEHDARDHRYAITVSILQDATPASVATAVAELRARPVAGIVLNTPYTWLDDLLIPPSPVSMVVVDGISHHTPVVAVDHRRGARLATDHLVTLGHKVIAHIAGPKDRVESLERESGWRVSVRAAGLRCGPLLRGDWSPRSAYDLGRRLLRREDVTAVVVANDMMAIGLMRLLQDEGLAVPDRMSVTGFDDLPEAAYLVPSLTTVRYDGYDLGRQTVRRLLADLDNPDGKRHRPERVMLEPTLVVRDSSQPPRRLPTNPSDQHARTSDRASLAGLKGGRLWCGTGWHEVC